MTVHYFGSSSEFISAFSRFAACMVITIFSGTHIFCSSSMLNSNVLTSYEKNRLVKR